MYRSPIAVFTAIFALVALLGLNVGLDPLVVVINAALDTQWVSFTTAAVLISFTYRYIRSQSRSASSTIYTAHLSAEPQFAVVSSSDDFSPEFRRRFNL